MRLANPFKTIAARRNEREARRLEAIAEVQAARDSILSAEYAAYEERRRPILAHYAEHAEHARTRDNLRYEAALAREAGDQDRAAALSRQAVEHVHAADAAFDMGNAASRADRQTYAATEVDPT